MVVQPNEEALDRAARLIQSGALVAFPTETVYGLGANALDEEAIARIYAVKSRPWASPLIVHVADEAMARSVTIEWPHIAQVLAARFWPGPLTMVLKKAAAIPGLVTAGLDTVGIRIPSHPIALALIRRAGVPIAAPSANRFTQLSPTTAEHVQQGLGEDIDLILDGGPTQVGIESTVVSLWRDPPVILRPGMISQTDLEAVSGIGWERETDLPKIVESPGMHVRHYAPRTPFHVLEPGAAKPAGRGRLIEMPSDPKAFAACLYAELHKADQEGWEWIAIAKPPETPEWAGVLDRLKRASAADE
ncbi:MAG TPA: L-threonylcarbamoyladenylate synthase [Bryobacteraceae bacterium]|nr:L-threonylcarbamoyladenylate synthase [Bryobacteraceae bacterium]